MIQTGIKALDFFAPLVKEGTTGLIARPGMGQLVILAELLHNLKDSNYKTVFLLPKGESKELDGTVELADVTSFSIEETLEKFKGLTSDIILITDRSYVVSGELFDLQEKLFKENLPPITTILLDLSGEVVDEDIPYGPLETVWQLDAELAARHFYPAVHPLYSTSSLLEGVDLDQRHFTLRQRALKLLRRYRELRAIVMVHGMEKIPAVEMETYERGSRLEAYFTQPFAVAEEFTKQPGKKVTLSETLDDVEAILDGKADDMEIKELTFIGSLA